MAIIFERGTNVKDLVVFLEVMCCEKDGKPVILDKDLAISVDAFGTLLIEEVKK